MTTNLFAQARDCLFCVDVDEKLARAAQLRVDWETGLLDTAEIRLADVVEAGRPHLPELVHPRKLPRRSFARSEGRLTLIHAVAHIEFNAINLACDALFRFRNMPQDYYDDWVRVTAEEAQHFQLLRERLRAGGCDYGDFVAHNGLWDMAMRTARDPLQRMALVPRMLEARGLDVTPAMIDRFNAAGDQAMVDVLSLILHEEIGHVQVGSRWFRHICAARGLEPEQTYFDLLDRFVNGEIRGPLHRAARLKAGFSESELVRLQQMCKR
jgi:uncharacterized ferritin-like protein (DUF455 family)